METNSMSCIKGNKGSTSRLTINFKSIITFFVFVYIIWLSFLAVFKAYLFGYPLFSMFFIAMATLFLLVCTFKSMSSRANLFVLFSFLSIVALIGSGFKGWSLFTSLYNMLLFALPVAFFYLPSLVDTNLNVDKVCRYICLMLLAAGIICILIYFGIMDSGLRYRISIIKVDNTIGLLGISTALYMLSARKETKKAGITLVMGAIVILTGQSRARMFLAFAVIVIFVFYLTFLQKVKGFKNLIGISIVSLVTFVVVFRNLGAFQEYLSFAIGKFQVIGEDSSSVYRYNEMKVHLDLFFENFFSKMKEDFCARRDCRAIWGTRAKKAARRVVPSGFVVII